MKKDIHPKYYQNAKVTCVCGNAFEVGSTKEEISTELCSVCHPFYTGKQRLVDTARRVEKFQEKAAKQAVVSKTRKGKKAKKAKKATETDETSKTSKTSPKKEAPTTKTSDNKETKKTEK